jgi:hypothetical protein
MKNDLKFKSLLKKMKKAIEKAIYYSDTENLTALIEFDYSNEKSFQDILKNLYSNIEVVATFQKAHFSIFENISQMYTTILAHKATAIYIINRQGIAIKLSRTPESADAKPRIGIIKLDAVLAESNSSSLYPFLFGTILGALPFFYAAFSSRN